MNDFWQTPEHILERVRKVLGDDYFDPAPVGHKVVDGVHHPYNGLECNWGDKSFINPPYSIGEIKRWAEKGHMEFVRRDMAGYNPEYIWLINYGACENRRFIKSNASAVCLLHKRIAFVSASTGLPSKSNDRDSIIYYWGGNTWKFHQAFKDLGEVFKR